MKGRPRPVAEQGRGARSEAGPPQGGRDQSGLERNSGGVPSRRAGPVTSSGSRPATHPPPDAAGEVLAFLGLGANVDRPRSNLSWAVRQLQRSDRLRVVAVASLYGSTPVGVTDQPDFLNTVVAVRTSLPADELLDLGLELESRAGRVRRQRWGPRPLDVDLLWYDGRVIQRPPRLEVPHPRLAERAFVLVPWAEIGPETWVPGRGTVAELAAAVDGTGVWLEETGAWWTRDGGDTDRRSGR